MATNQTGIISSAMSGNQTPDYSGQITDYYNSYLGRAPKQNEVDYWSGQMNNGMSATDVQNSFINSPERQAYLQQQSMSPTSQASPAPNGQATTQPTAATYQSAQLGDPTKFNVTPEQTTAGLINQYTDQNSPIIQAAMTRAKEQQNANGTLNSSMAETAGQLAAYQAAVPLAQQDAQTYSKAAAYNADETNQFDVQNATFKNQEGQFNAAAQNTLTGQKMSADASLASARLNADTQRFLGGLSSQTQQAIAGLDNQSKMALAQLDSGTKTQLEQLDNQNKQLLQTNSSAANMFAAYMQQIGNISSSTTMDQAAKDTATQNAIANLNQGLQVLQGVSNIDLSKYFVPGTFAPPPQPAQPATPEVSTPNFNMLMNEGSTGG